ncbi:MAG: hypothetical protein ACI9DC_003326 [Gammaproteobacteria bacterium]|jgi:hypothetical protein
MRSAKEICRRIGAGLVLTESLVLSAGAFAECSDNSWKECGDKPWVTGKMETPIGEKW